MRLDELDLDETNSTYSATYWDEITDTWKQFLYRGKYRYFWPDALGEVLDQLNQDTAHGQYRIYRHDTTRER